MRDSINADRIANSILQRKNKYNNFILVEGAHDRLFFSKYQMDKTQIEISFGWENVVDILEKLNSRGYKKVLGIIDRDLREIIPENLDFDETIILTDEHDINILCLEKSFQIVFDSYASESKISLFKESKSIDCLKAYTHSLVRNISYLKIVNKRKRLHLSFKSNNGLKNRLDYSKFIDKNGYELISTEKLVETIIDFSRNKTSEAIPSKDEILDILKGIMESEKPEDVKLNSGHDFAEIICLGLRKVLGTTDVSPEVFLKECILSYDSVDFCSTSLYSTIKKIEAKQMTKYLKV